MKKGIVAVLLSLCILTPICAEDNSERITEIEKRIVELNQELEDLNAELKGLKKEDGFVYEHEGSIYSYLKNEVVERDGEEYAVIYFEYTNNTGDVSSASRFVGMEGFQDGVQLTESSLYGYGIEALDNLNTQVQSGVTIEVARAYKLTSRNDLTLYVGFMGAWDPEEYTIVLE